MTTHVLIVDEITFNVHLEYLFAGTGAGTRDVDFNNKPTTKLYAGKKHKGEDVLVAMIADGSRIREGDFIIFYVRAAASEGKFYGIFQSTSNGVFLEHYSSGQYLLSELKKNLTFRFRFKPYEGYPEGVTEWEALDEIKYIKAPQQMLWSLIYRKLRANRGNTMITIYESERLFDLIRKKNNFVPLNFNPSFCLNYDKKKIVLTSKKQPKYTGGVEDINLLPRMCKKYTLKLAHEVHLQQYIIANVGMGTNKTLDKALGVINKKIEWIGNEVACGVGMQRIDVMLSIIKSQDERILMPIELKAVPVTDMTVKQLDRYIDWIEQYYITNRSSTIQPVLICRAKTPQQKISPSVQSSFNVFNSRGTHRYLPLLYIEYYIDINNKDIIFKIK